MVINQDLFAFWMEELSGFYGKNLSQVAFGIYYRKLSEQMNDQQFQFAVEEAIVNHKFMPTVQELVELGVGNSDVLAANEWELCVKAAARADKTMLSGLTPQGQAALKLVGGINKIGQTEEEGLRWIQKSFMSIWKASKSDPRSLPEAKDYSQKYLPEVSGLSDKFSF